MKTSQSFGIHFTIRKDRVKEGKAQVYACITVNKQKCFIALQQSIDLRYWDERRGTGKGGPSGFIVVNNYHEQVRLDSRPKVRTLYLTLASELKAKILGLFQKQMVLS